MTRIAFLSLALLPLFAASHLAARAVAAESPDRWEKAIAAFEAADKENPPPKNGVVFIGSSSIRLWDLEKSFPGRGYINRGFGGSQIAHSVRYADRILLPYEPRIVVFYAGDNDIAAGVTAEQARDDYKAFVKKVHDRLPATKIIYISIKPSLARAKLLPTIQQANRLIAEVVATDPRLRFVDVHPSMIGEDGSPREELLRKDGLHLNAAGYALWTKLLEAELAIASQIRNGVEADQREAEKQAPRPARHGITNLNTNK